MPSVQQPTRVKGETVGLWARVGTVLVELEVVTVLEATPEEDNTVLLVEATASLLDEGCSVDVECGAEVVLDTSLLLKGTMLLDEGCSDDVEGCEELVIGALEEDDPLPDRTLEELAEDETGEDVPAEVLDEVVEATVDVTKVDEELLTLYSSRRLPSPQYWYWLPAHFMLHSLRGAVLLVACKSLPQ